MTCDKSIELGVFEIVIGVMPIELGVFDIATCGKSNGSNVFSKRDLGVFKVVTCDKSVTKAFVENTTCDKSVELGVFRTHGLWQIN